MYQRLQCVECAKHGDDMRIVLGLCGSKASFVDSRVYVPLHPDSNAVDFGSVVRGIESDGGEFRREHAIEGGWEGAQELSAFL